MAMKTPRAWFLPCLTATLLLLARSGPAAITISESQSLEASDGSLDGQDVVVHAATLTVAGSHAFASLRLENGAVLNHPPAPTGETASALRLVIAGDLHVDETSRIDANGLGYARPDSPGAGTRGNYAGAGGGHGGLGHRSAGTSGAGGPAHGSITAPDSWGGPGANGANGDFAPGGGLIRLEVGGTLTLLGRVQANGASAWINDQGGGAGGTVFLRALAFAGSGTITANGGGGEWVDGGGGAGGRIALLAERSGFTGTVTAEGAGGAGIGGAGTIYLKTGNPPGLLRVQNSRRGEWTPITSPVPYDIAILGQAVAYPTAPLTLGHLTVDDSALLLHEVSQTNLVIQASGNVTIGTNAAISVDGRGYPRGEDRGPGAGSRASGWAGSGAGHGGFGATAQPGGPFGSAYGSILQPVTMGSQGGDSSSGPGTPGGGAIRLIVGGTLAVHGRLSADGGGAPANDAGGGSGGSLWLTVGTLAGSGSITVNGGPGEWVEGGGGGGGRIAIYCGTTEFNGTLTAYGGPARRGGAGSIYLRRTHESEGELLIDNGGTWGNYTPISSPEPFRVVLANRAWVFPESPLTVRSLVVGTNTELTHLTTQSNLAVHVLGHATFAGVVSADGRGYPRGDDRGPGQGTTASGWGGTGASHGGLGSTAAPGGSIRDVYGSLLEPTDLGSQGGNGSGGAGTAGGGAIRLVVDGQLTVDGRLSAEGAGAPPNDAGGGSGGSLWLTVGSLAGSGAISANGGPGEWVEGGGGGGGRIAIYYGTHQFLGAITAYGGPNRRGGAGTIYLRQNNEVPGLLVVDNGGTWGNYTPLPFPEPFRLVISNFAAVYPRTAFTVQSLVVGTNTVLTHLNTQSNLSARVLGDAVIAGILTADGRGYPRDDDRGPGQGLTIDGWAGGGAGHGGLGATAQPGRGAGPSYGSILQPVTLGSQGANGSGGAGTAGGGAIRLVVDGKLTVDGRISSEGAGGPANDAGGGSGGSLWLTVGSLAGGGTLSVNGGPGEWVEGGGGGGGRIALYYGANDFAGAITAYGGPSRRGGAGTIYTRRNGTASGQLLVDNGGTWGNYTPLSSPEPFQLTLAGNAYVYPESPLALRDLIIRTNSTLTHLAGQGRCEITVLDSLTVSEGGAMSTDGRGYPVGDDRGPGTGTRVSWGGGGGSHGGMGGRSPSGAVGGPVYGSLTEPLTYGSAGGIGDGGSGGAGGGVIRLIVPNALVVDGSLTARGLNAPVNNSGGGAGGSIYITAGSLSGKGLLSVEGGQGEWVDGGSGGGGRIALYLGTDTFAGSLSVRGGPRGGEAGGSGTLYRRVGNDPGGDLVFENGDRGGALTPLSVPPRTRLVLGAGTYLYPTGRLAVASLHLKPGATLTHLTGQSNLLVEVAGDFLVDSNAVVSADAKGYPVGADRGPGAGARLDWSGSGGAHGGNGGAGRTGVPGGLAYDSILRPAALGGPGGAGGGGAGTPGGGAIRFIVGGRLVVDGTVTANGGGGAPNDAGGGAGGSIWIDAGSLLGSGSFSANGGAGEWVDGGGGAGGRIAFHLGTNSFSGSVTARGAGGNEPGGAGTIYSRIGQETVGTVLVENGDVWGAYTPLVAEEPFHLTLARRAQAYPDPALLVGSLDVRTNAVLAHLVGQPNLDVAVLGDARIDGVLFADGRGYPVAGDPGPGAGGRSGWAGSGAGHGGQGGKSATQLPGGPAYGSPLQPIALGSQGGSGDGGPGGAGGGAIQVLTGGTLTVDGSITANGRPGANNNSGGGSGGSIFLNARAFAGAGSLQAKGAPGEWVDGGGGAGGRIAIYRTASSFTGTFDVAGAGGSGQGANGTIHEDDAPGLVWLAPAEGWVYGEIQIQIASFASTDGTLQCRFDLRSAAGTQTLGTVPITLAAGLLWDSTTVPDGPCEIQATLLDAQGSVVAQSSRALLVNNAVTWEAGFLAESTTWSRDRVHVIRGDLEIAEGVTLALEPGTIVKLLPGARLVIRAGATLDSRATAEAPVVLTSFLDDSVAGDSNLDGAATRATPGAWRLVLNASGHFEPNDQTRLRYHSQTFGGPIPTDTTWTGDSLREITESIVVLAGATLRLEPGAILKFAPNQGLTVESGGSLVVAGSRAQPVVLTSLADDAFGGDSNSDGARTRPAAGDWRSLRFLDGATATLDHALIRFGGNSVGNPWGAGGAIEALGGPLIARHCVISDALKDGAFCYGSTRFENCLVLRCDRGLTAVGTMDVVHTTIDECRIGLLEHVGQLNVRNSIVSRSIDVGIEHDLGGGSPVVTACNVWNPDARRGNYHGLADRTGRDGNLSAAPRYQDPDADDFHLNYASPGIDAADGSFSPATDFAGAPRYDDPRTGNTGTPAANGAPADIGAFEFVESAPSDIDLVVTQVFGPGQVTAGDLVHVDWIIANGGAEPFAGPWHDAVYLRHAATGARLLVSEALVGQNLVVGPGQSVRVGADVRVPGGVTASYQWSVAGNSRGDLFEGANANNNESLSGTSTALDVPVLELDGPAVAASFAAQEQPLWFRCVAPAGKDVRFLLDLAASEGVTELYVGRDFMPSPENFTARQREFASPDTSAVASASVPGETGDDATGSTFYLLVTGRVLAEAPASFTLEAETAPFAIESVANGPVGNTGPVTLDLRGAGFATNTVFTLRLGGQERVGLRQSVRAAGRAHVTFDLAGVPAGEASLTATLGGLSVTRPNAVTIREGGIGDFHASLSGPATTRAGRLSTWFITYGNRGAIDVRLPLLRLRAPGATEFQVLDNTLNWADSITILALHPDVLLPTLGPGQEVTFEVRIKAMNPLTVSLDVLAGEEFAADTTAFAWNSLAAPAGVDPARWNAMLATLPERLGATASDYQRRLEDDLATIAADGLRYAYLANVNGRWLFGDEPVTRSTPMPIIELPPGSVVEPTGAAGLALHGAPPKKIPGDGIRKTWFVIITMEDYQRARDEGVGAGNTRNVRSDWVDLRQYLKQDLRVPDAQFAGGHDLPGDNARWTRDNILTALRSFTNKVDADDNLVVVYSGHGGRTKSGNTGYLVGNGGSVSPAAFTQAIDAVGAGTTYFINNSCHSEAFNELVTPANTTFVGYAATQKDRIAWSDPAGSPMIAKLKGRLRKCNSLGLSMDLTEQLVAYQYRNETNVVDRQHPVLTNPTGASLEGKPWNDPSGFEQILRRTLNDLRFHPWGQAFLNLVGSVDPNDKYALAGAGPQHWVHPAQALPFQVLFENKTNAAAPAQEVLVVDDLDPRFDWSTFELGTMTFNDARVVVPPGLQRFSGTARVGTDPYEVTIDASLNPVTGRVTWLLRSRDPLTGDLPEDPFAGFLPPNDASHRGEGSLAYSIRPNPGLPDGTQITNRATIIFDPTYGANPPIVTPWVTNTVDAVAPDSTVAALPGSAIGEVPVQWSGADAEGGSGVVSFDIYASRDRGPFVPWLLGTPDTTARFLGEPGSNYRFYSVARDAAGNVETPPDQPDASIDIGGTVVGPVAIQFDGTRIRVLFHGGTLQTATALAGPWTDIPGAASPYIVTTADHARFYRARR